jgi:hypothetical protein
MCQGMVYLQDTAQYKVTLRSAVAVIDTDSI